MRNRIQKKFGYLGVFKVGVNIHIYKIMNKQTLLYLAIAAAVVSTVYFSTQETKDEFGMWKKKFNFQFTESENLYRSVIFYKNLAMINAHNSKADRTYDMGLNQFSALTEEEFVSTYLSPKPYNPEWENVDTTMPKVTADADWVAQGKVSPVKNQGNCGSCWAFSAVGVLESWALFKNQKWNLSEQQLVDCSKKYGNEGCNGGFNYQGLAYVKDNGIAN
jgi:cathepsin L